MRGEGTRIDDIKGNNAGPKGNEGRGRSLKKEG